MEAFKSHGGYVSFGWSGDVANPRRARWTCGNHQGVWQDGQTDEDAWAKLDRELSQRQVEASEPEQL